MILLLLFLLLSILILSFSYEGIKTEYLMIYKKIIGVTCCWLWYLLWYRITHSSPEESLWLLLAFSDLGSFPDYLQFGQRSSWACYLRGKLRRQKCFLQRDTMICYPWSIGISESFRSIFWIQALWGAVFFAISFLPLHFIPYYQTLLYFVLLQQLWCSFMKSNKGSFLW